MRKRLRRLTDRRGLGLMLGLGVVLLAFLAPVIASHSPTDQIPGFQLKGPSADHWLGTDQLSRDVWSRLLYGARTSLLIVVPGVAAGAVVGTALGAVSGYFRGIADAVVSRVADVALAYPAIILGLIIVATFGSGKMPVTVALAVFNVPIFTRVVRGLVMGESAKEYVLAARCMGAGDTRILVRHIIPNIDAHIVVQLIISIGTGVVVESGLSFLGLGVQPPEPSWGTLLSDAKQFLRDAPVLGIAPGVMLTLFVLGLNLYADESGRRETTAQ